MLVKLRWWLVFCLSLISLLILQLNGLLAAMWQTDSTYLCSVIIGVYLIATTCVGRLTFQKQAIAQSFSSGIARVQEEDRIELRVSTLQDVSQHLLGLGMIGTMVGFMQTVANGNLSKFDPNNVATAQAILGSMGYGLTTAVLTTLVGLVCSMLLQIQLRNLDYIEEK